jgi:hypothetical protein
MQNSQLVQLLQAFSPQEKKEIRRFLNSPYFNTRTDTLRLFEYGCTTKNWDKEAVKSAVFGQPTTSDEQLRLLMTYLMRLLETWIAQKEFDENTTQQNLLLASGLRKRGLTTAFERQKKWLEKHLGQQPLRDVTFYDAHYHLHWEMHQLVSSTKPTYTEHLEKASVAADIAYIAQKMRIICLSAAQQEVYSSDFYAAWEKEVVAFAEQYFAEQEVVVAIYLHCYKMLRQPHEEVHFQRFKTMLLDSLRLFAPDENKGFFVWAINYCVKRLNQGQKHYFKEVTDLYKSGLEQGILLENGEISTYTYYNVVVAGLQTQDLEWVNFFIYQYKNQLPKQHRDSAFSFCLARLEYTQKNFGAVLELLQKVNYRDTLVNLAAKTLLLKTWFELQEYEALQSHLDAMRNFIHRKKVLGYHRTNYLNIIKYTDKILNLNKLDKSEQQKLRESIQKEENLTEREWLLEKLGGGG